MNEILESNGMTQQECRLMDIDYIQPKVEGGNKMATLREEAQAYEPPQTKNIADLEEARTDLEVEEREGMNNDGKKFSYKVVVLNGEDYRVPASVLKSLKAILEDKPELQRFKVKKSGEGLKTEYVVIPLD
ncbi:hypothetical protein LCGC14_3018650 [marine sediment metagenome]|uniref:Uncharacterized protein n=1 Tax=marine sediment metagenome TaxID=412755 RepID=A0A0F8XEI4_9ZZZZ